MYFVTIDGKTHKSDLNRALAVKIACRLMDEGKPNVGIGREKIVKGEKVYTLLPVGLHT